MADSSTSSAATTSKATQAVSSSASNGESSSHISPANGAAHTTPDGGDEDEEEDEDNDDGGASGSTSKKSKSKSKKKKKKSKAARARDAAVPISHIDSSVPLPTGVRAHYFDSVKGKGLVATRDFEEGDVIFVEEAFIAAPPAQAVNDMLEGKLCSQCFLPVEGATLAVRCDNGACRARFCNRLCESRGQATHHRLLCIGQNPAVKPFLAYLAQHRWLSLHNVARTLARVLLTHSSTPPPSMLQYGPASSSKPTHPGMTLRSASLAETLEHINAFASVSELQRRARNPSWELEQAGFEAAMKEGLRLLQIGLNPYDEDGNERKGRSKAIRDFPKDVAKDLFSWETFLKHLGRANLNMEAQGGMYLVHSMLNHSCEPNVKVSHPPLRSVKQATKIGVLAAKPIKEGEELLLTYQTPNLSLARRRLLLWREYMFGPCTCTRCQLDLAALSPSERTHHESSGGWKRDEQELAEVQQRKEHAQMLEKLDADRKAKLESEGKSGERDLSGLEDELRTSLGF